MSSSIPEGAVVLSDPKEVLRRQVHPSRIGKDGLPMRVAFQPNSGDDGLMSTLREKVPPKEAFRRFTEDQGKESAGTWGVPVETVVDAGLQCFDDSATVCPDHASVDFNSKDTTGQIKQASRKLHSRAVDDGHLFRLE